VPLSKCDAPYIAQRKRTAGFIFHPLHLSSSARSLLRRLLWPFIRAFTPVIEPIARAVLGMAFVKRAL
jgi:hypothetical protein